MYRHVLTLGALCCLVILFVSGCGKKKITINPEYRTKTAVLAPIPNAEKVTIALCAFNVSEAQQDPGGSYNNVAYGMGRMSMEKYTLSGNIGITIANALAFQLEKANFKTIVVKDRESLKALKTPTAVLSGDLNTFRCKLVIKFFTVDMDGETQFAAKLTNSAETPIYQGLQQWKDHHAKGGARRSWENDFASDLMTEMIDDFCAKTDFRDALTKLAAAAP